MNKLIKYLIVLVLLCSNISSFQLYAQNTLPTTLFIGETQVVKDGELCATTSGSGWYYENGTLYFTSEKFFNSSSYAYSDSNTAEIYADGNLVVDTTNANQNIQYQEYSTKTKCIFYVSGTLKLIGDGVLQTRITNGGDGRAFGVIANTLDLSDFKGTYTTAGCYAAGNVNQLILPKSNDLKVMGEYESNRGNDVQLINDGIDLFALRYFYLGKVHTLSFNGNGANGSMDDLYIRDGYNLNPIPTNTFTHPNGGNFLGWTLSNDSNVVEYQDESIIYNITQDQTLYALWDQEIDQNDTVSIDSIELKENELSLKQGSTYLLKANVIGKGNYDSSITYSISNTTSNNTTISEQGLISIAHDETSDQIRVVVTSKVDPSISAVCNINVINANYVSKAEVNNETHYFETPLQMENFIKQQKSNITITLLKNMNYDFTFEHNNEITLDLNQHTLTATLMVKSYLILKNGTFKGDLNVNSTSITLDNMTFTSTNPIISNNSIIAFNNQVNIDTKSEPNLLLMNNSRIEIHESATNNSFNVLLGYNQQTMIGYETLMANITSYDLGYEVKYGQDMIIVEKKLFDIIIETNHYGVVVLNKKQAYFNEIITMNLRPYDKYMFDNYEIISNNVTIKDNSFIMPKANVHIKVNFTLEFPFIDVDVNEWYYQSIKNIYRLDYMGPTGKGNEYFEPNAPLTRGMVTTILYRMEAKPPFSFKAVFSDVRNPKLWYATAISWASHYKVVSGYKDGRFGPDDNITRQDLAIMLRNYAQKCGLVTTSNISLASFKDANKVDDYACSAIKWCVENKIISGATNKDGVYLNPKQPCSRAQAAKMFYVLYTLIN